MPPIPRPVAALAAALAFAAAGCAGGPTPADTQAVRARHNPADKAQRTITNFTPALRCMDDMLFRSGTRDVTLMMEEMRDATQRVPVSTRDMFTSAVSEMTRRSRAVRLSVFGNDQQNTLQVLQLAQRNSVFSVVPEYSVRGTVSQFDEDVRRNSSSFGLLVKDLFGLRLGNETRFSVLAFDAAVVRTDSFTLVPGVASKNTTVLARRDSNASDGQARLQGAGTVFAFSSAASEGTSSAARNMVELATIELVGKLVKAPYWQCLGIDDADPEVRRELEDWFLSMDESERTVFLKSRLRERGYFDGALDDARTPEFESALQAYRRALGLAGPAAQDQALFSRVVTQPVVPGPFGVGRRLPPAVAAAASAPAAAAEPAPAPAAAGAAATAAAVPAPPPLPAAQLIARPAGGGSQLQLTLQLSGEGGAYVYCYAQDPATGAIRRIFPNRFANDPRVNVGRNVHLPGRGRFRLSARHQHACVMAPREVYAVLPPQLRWGDFEDIRLGSFEAIREQFALASGLPVLLLRP